MWQFVQARGSAREVREPLGVAEGERAQAAHQPHGERRDHRDLHAPASPPVHAAVKTLRDAIDAVPATERVIDRTRPRSH